MGMDKWEYEVDEIILLLLGFHCQTVVCCEQPTNPESTRISMVVKRPTLVAAAALIEPGANKRHNPTVRIDVVQLRSVEPVVVKQHQRESRQQRIDVGFIGVIESASLYRSQDGCVVNKLVIIVVRRGRERPPCNCLCRELVFEYSCVQMGIIHGQLAINRPASQ